MTDTISSFDHVSSHQYIMIDSVVQNSGIKTRGLDSVEEYLYLKFNMNTQVIVLIPNIQKYS